MKPGLAALAATAATLAIAGSAAADDATAAVGVWQSPSRGAHIQIVPCDSGAICGKLLSASRPKSNPQLLDIHNKDPALRDRSMIGQIVFDGFKGGPMKWTGGRLYNPGDGNYYSGVLSLVDINHLQLKGCAFWFLCKAQTWTRVE
jgi:uncharacterized protein (DUF2147 family)